MTPSTTPEAALKWLALSDDGEIYYPDTASDDPKAAALEHFQGYGEEAESVTVGQFRIGDVTDMLPDSLFGDFLEGLGESLIEQFSDDSAEGEMVSGLYHIRNQPNPAHTEVNALLRPAFELWWRKYAAGYGVKAYYTATGRELTFTAEELKHAE